MVVVVDRADRVHRQPGSAGHRGARAGIAVTDVATEPASRRLPAANWAVALVVATDLPAVEAAVRTALPTTHVQLVAKSRVVHLVVRIPLTGPAPWPGARKSLTRLAVATGCHVLTVSPRADDSAEDVETRRARAQALLPVLLELPIPMRLVDLDELMPFEVLSVLDPGTQERIVRRILGPVLDQPGGIGRRQLATLEALHWHDGSAKSAAVALGVHAKTIHNRLRRFEGVTGLWLDHPPDRMRIDMALYLWRARKAGIVPEA